MCDRIVKQPLNFNLIRMKKKHAKKIREITEAVGQVTTVTEEWVPISGHDLLLSGYGKMNTAKHIRPEKSYELCIPVEHFHSIKKDLKRAYRKGQEDGVLDYVKKIYNERVKM